MSDVDLSRNITATPYRLLLYWPGCPDKSFADEMSLYLHNEGALQAFIERFISETGYVRVERKNRPPSAPGLKIWGPASSLVPKLFVDKDSPLKSAHEANELKALDIFKQIFFKQQ